MRKCLLLLGPKQCMKPTRRCKQLFSACAMAGGAAKVTLWWHQGRGGGAQRLKSSTGGGQEAAQLGAPAEEVWCEVSLSGGGAKA
jgi:hypothetical protein